MTTSYQKDVKLNSLTTYQPPANLDNHIVYTAGSWPQVSIISSIRLGRCDTHYRQTHAVFHLLPWHPESLPNHSSVCRWLRKNRTSNTLLHCDNMPHVAEVNVFSHSPSTSTTMGRGGVNRICPKASSDSDLSSSSRKSSTKNIIKCKYSVNGSPTPHSEIKNDSNSKYK